MTREERVQMAIREIQLVMEHLAQCEDCVKLFNQIQKHDMETSLK